MRTLTAEATAEQKKNSYVPFVEAVFQSRNRATTLTFNNRPSLIPNGGWEGGANPAANGWTASGTGSATVVTTAPLDGAKHLKLSLTGSGTATVKYENPSFAVLKGKTVVFSVYNRTANSGTPTTYRIVIDDGVGTTVTNLNTSTTYTQVTATRTLHVSATKLSFEITIAHSGSTQDFYVDRMDAYPTDVTSMQKIHTFKDVPTIESVHTTEGRFGGALSAPGVPFQFSAVLRISDPYDELQAKNLNGYRVDIGWGLFTTANGWEKSEGEPYIIVQHQATSRPEGVGMELYLASFWNFLHMLWASQASTNGFEWTGETVKQVLHELLGGAALEGAGTSFAGLSGSNGTCVFWIDGATDAYQDYRASSSDPDTTTAIMHNTVNSKFYIGMVNKFDHITIDLGQAATFYGGGTFSLVYEYWDGDSWETIPDLGTVTEASTTSSNLKTTGLFCLNFAIPSDWAVANFRVADPGDGANALFVNGDAYYIRIRCAALHLPLAVPIATRIFVAQDFGVQISTTTAGQGDDTAVHYRSETGESITQVLNFILSQTKMGIVLTKDVFDVRFIDPSGSADYSYVIPSDGSNHAAYWSNVDKHEIIPNTVTYVDALKPGGVAPNQQGVTQADSSSVAAHGTIPIIVENLGVATDAIGTTLAQNHIHRLLRDAATGQIEVPMNIGQEMWDRVTITDSRSGITHTGSVSQIKRTFDSGEYSMMLSLGRRNSQYVVSSASQDSHMDWVRSLSSRPDVPDWNVFRPSPYGDEPRLTRLQINRMLYDQPGETRPPDVWPTFEAPGGITSAFVWSTDKYAEQFRPRPSSFHPQHIPYQGGGKGFEFLREQDVSGWQEGGPKKGARELGKAGWKGSQKQGIFGEPTWDWGMWVG